MVGRLTEQLERVVCEFRLGAEASACEELAAFIDELSQALTSTQSGLNADVLLPILQRALEAQTRTDYVELVDVLQYELRPMM